MDGIAAVNERTKARSTHVSASSNDRRTGVRQTTERSGSNSVAKDSVNYDASDGSRAPKRRKNVSLKWHLSSEYRDLLNDTIRDVNGTSIKDAHEPLPSSLVSGSYWNVLEKGSFFLQLSLTGPGDLPKLASAVGTKSEPEIKAYLLLLEQGVREIDAEARLGDRFSLAEVPAANEIGYECETMMDRASEAFGKFVEKEEAKREEAKYGDWWLVNETAAKELDDLLASGAGKELVRKAEHGIKTEETDEMDGAPASIPEEIDAHLQPSLPVPSASLLNPTAFLQVSRLLFMNSNTDPDANWHSLHEPKGAQDEPAIYRTAFDDFYNLILSLTRRLVQASIFQSMSRLRASTDSRVVPSINSRDVEAAMNVLGMKCDKKDYWAKAARRCSVQVYSEKRQYFDGRVTGKNGVKLTYEEVAAELGLHESDEELEVQPVTEADIHDLEIDNDASTETGSEHELPEDPEGDGSANEFLTPESPTRGRSTKRKRALSPGSYDRAEDDHLERLDKLAGVEDENRLRAALDMEQLPLSKSGEPEMAFRRAGQDERLPCWRDVVDYYAPWEMHGLVDSTDFEAMGIEGRRARKRRELVRDAIRHQKRLGESNEESTGEGTASGDRSEDEAEQQAESGAGFDSD